MCTKGYTLIEVFILLILLFIIGGWFINFYHFAELDFEPPYKAEVIRGSAIIIFPISPFVAAIEFEEEKNH